ncbi:MAG TPA: GAF domain-containing SpoIIE family protein phosphatase [Marmoricola sp.]|nr:GAF domain-containing SpoIIE family protein phosphatase [Marmoricola sp.]
MTSDAAGPRDHGDDPYRRRLHQLEQLTDLALSKLGLEELLTELLVRTRELLETDTAAVLLTDETGEFLVATAACGIEEEVRQGSRVPIGRGFAGKVAAERRPVAIAEVTPTTVVNPVLLYKGIQSMLGVPLLDEDDRVLGVLHVGTLRKRFFVEEDAELLQRVADRVAAEVRMENARTDVAAAAALQRSLAPGKLPQAVGLELAARYVPGSRSGVGGDWYDVFDLPDGRLGITIGDVMGHGLRAATVMGRIRAALRAYAMRGPDPATVLRELDEYLQHFEPGVLATAIYAIQVPGSSTVTLAAAGHVAPVLTGPEQGARLVELPEDLLLGVEPQASRSNVVLELVAGGMLCLYTDGLIERRGDGMRASLDTLCATLARDRGSAETVCANIMSELVGDQAREDDVALVVIRRRG